MEGPLPWTGTAPVRPATQKQRDCLPVPFHQYRQVELHLSNKQTRLNISILMLFILYVIT